MSTFTEKLRSYARKGYIDRLSNLSVIKPIEEWKHGVDTWAAREGRSAVIVWLSQRGYRMNWNQVAIQAAKGGHLDILKIVYAKDTSCIDEYIVQIAIERNLLPVLQWIRSLSPSIPLTPQDMYTAITQKNADMVKWLLENGCPTNIKCYRISKWPENKNIEIQELLHRFKVEGEWKCRKGYPEECKYCSRESEMRKRLGDEASFKEMMIMFELIRM
jgi:hypothetical protein